MEMAILSTGPIENSPVSGVRPTQMLTVKIVNHDLVNPYSLVIQGFILAGTRTMYVNEVLTLAPNGALAKNYYADLDAFEFVFATIEEVETEMAISVWGKQTTGQLVDAHRVVTWEKHEVII